MADLTYYRSHPWHGLPPGRQIPDVVTAFIEMNPSDTVKYEIEKVSGHLKLDRPQKYSSSCPALYGFIPRTLCDKKVAELARINGGKKDIEGDQDPLDIMVICERHVDQSGIIVDAVPIGGLKMFDGDEADDKIIAVLENDPVYGHITSIHELPEGLLDRVRHYFLTYKEMPDRYRDGKRKIEISQNYDRDTASQVIRAALDDYNVRYYNAGQ